MNETPGNFPLTLADLLDRKTPAISPWSVIQWWETRRWIYNGVVGLAGLGTVFVYYCATGVMSFLHPPAGFDFILFGFVVLYALGANICYTAGWISEIVLRQVPGTETDQLAKFAFVAGTVVSALLTLIPAVFAAGAGLLSILLLRNP